MLPALPGAVLRCDYRAGGKEMLLEWFMFFEQFDPNPVTGVCVVLE